MHDERRWHLIRFDAPPELDLVCVWAEARVGLVGALVTDITKKRGEKGREALADQSRSELLGGGCSASRYVVTYFYMIQAKETNADHGIIMQYQVIESTCRALWPRPSAVLLGIIC